MHTTGISRHLYKSTEIRGFFYQNSFIRYLDTVTTALITHCEYLSTIASVAVFSSNVD